MIFRFVIEFYTCLYLQMRGRSEIVKTSIFWGQASNVNVRSGVEYVLLWPQQPLSAYSANQWCSTSSPMFSNLLTSCDMLENHMVYDFFLKFSHWQLLHFRKHKDKSERISACEFATCALDTCGSWSIVLQPRWKALFLRTECRHCL